MAGRGTPADAAAVAPEARWAASPTPERRGELTVSDRPPGTSRCRPRRRGPSADARIPDRVSENVAKVATTRVRRDGPVTPGTVGRRQGRRRRAGRAGRGRGLVVVGRFPGEPLEGRRRSGEWLPGQVSRGLDDDSDRRW